MIKPSVKKNRLQSPSISGKEQVQYGDHLKSSGCTGRVADVLAMMHARATDLGSDPALFMSHMVQRLWGWATSFNTMQRAWHTNHFSNIICHKWRCILQPNSWLRALLVMPIRAVFTYPTRATCQTEGWFTKRECINTIRNNLLFSGILMLRYHITGYTLMLEDIRSQS